MPKPLTVPCPNCKKGIRVRKVFEVFNCPHCDLPFAISIKLVKDERSKNGKNTKS